MSAFSQTLPYAKKMLSNMISLAAIIQDGKVYTVPRPGRHHDIIWLLAKLGFKTPIIGEQGFTDFNGNFVDRYKARIIAEENNQLIERAQKHSMMLFSEDLWEGFLTDEQRYDILTEHMVNRLNQLQGDLIYG